MSLSQTRHNLPDVREPHESGEVDEGKNDDGDDGEGGGDVESREEEDGHEDGGQRDGQRGEREGHHVQVLNEGRGAIQWKSVELESISRLVL